MASDAEVKVDFNAGKFTVLVDIKHIDKDALTVTLSEGADWLTHEITLEGETSDNAKLDFSYTRLAGAESREAAITIGAPGAESVSVAVKQMPEPMIRPEQASYKLGAEAGTLEIRLKRMWNMKSLTLKVQTGSQATARKAMWRNGHTVQ